MELDGKTLTPVIIEANEVKTVYDKRNVSIIDFEFCEDRIVLLIKEKRAYYLRLLDANSLFLEEMKLSIKPRGLVLDCFSNLQVLTQDSCYQFNLKNRSFSHIYSIQEFNQFLRPCKAVFDSTLVVQNFSDYNQSIAYYRLNRNTFEKKLLVKVREDSKIEMAQHFDVKISTSKAPSIIGDIYPDNPPEKNSEIAKDHVEDQFFFDLALNNEIYHPIFKHNDSLFLFDHFNGKTIVYSENGGSIRSFPIQYLVGKWFKPLFFDAKKGLFYVLCSSAEKEVRLFQLSMKNGAILQTHSLHFNFLLARKIRVWNGYVYYLYRKSTTSGFWKLYKHKLD